MMTLKIRPLLQVLRVRVCTVQRGDRIPAQTGREVGGRGAPVHLQPDAAGLQDLL